MSRRIALWSLIFAVAFALPLAAGEGHKKCGSDAQACLNKLAPEQVASTVQTATATRHYRMLETHAEPTVYYERSGRLGEICGLYNDQLGAQGPGFFQGFEDRHQVAGRRTDTVNGLDDVIKRDTGTK